MFRVEHETTASLNQMSIQEGSFTMKKMTGGLLVLATLLVTGAGDLTAQQSRRGQQRQGPAAVQGARGAQVQGMRGRQMQGRGADQGGVEAIMRMRERLELTDAQISELDGLRSQGVTRRNAQMATMAELRSRMAAGEIQRSEIIATMEAQREGADGIREQHRARIDAILTEGQRESLQQMQRVGRAFQAGRAAGAARGGPAGRGMRAQRGSGGGQGIRARGPAGRGPGAGMRGRGGQGDQRGPPMRGRGMMRGPGGQGGPIGADSAGIGIAGSENIGLV